MIQVVKEGGTGSKTIWREIHTTHKGLNGIKEGEKIITDPDKIRRIVEEHFLKIGNQIKNGEGKTNQTTWG